jgi:hypothetical protein
VFGIDAEPVHQLLLKPTQIEEGRLRKRVNQNIQIAALVIDAVQDRTEHPRIRRAESRNDRAHGLPMLL